MFNLNYLKMVIAALVGAAVSVPSIAAGYYTVYLIVTAVGN